MRRLAASFATVEAVTMNRNSKVTPQTSGNAASAIGYFDPVQPIANLNGNLPHWRQAGVTYFVTFRLGDSIPVAKLDLWRRKHAEWLNRHPEPYDLRTRREYFRLFVERFHRWLDSGYGECLLAHPSVRKIVVDALSHFDGSRYELRERVVLPNHVHAVVTPTGEPDLSQILHSWKSYTAKKMNQLLGRTGPIRQKESFDHIPRGPDQLERIERYFHNNPEGMGPETYTRGCTHT